MEPKGPLRSTPRPGNPPRNTNSLRLSTQPGQVSDDKAEPPDSQPPLLSRDLCPQRTIHSTNKALNGCLVFKVLQHIYFLPLFIAVTFILVT